MDCLNNGRSEITAFGSQQQSQPTPQPQQQQTPVPSQQQTPGVVNRMEYDDSLESCFNPIDVNDLLSRQL